MNTRKFIKDQLYFLNSNPFSRLLFEQEIIRRSRLPLLAINDLTKRLNMFSPFTAELHKPNDWYGKLPIQIYFGTWFIS